MVHLTIVFYHKSSFYYFEFIHFICIFDIGYINIDSINLGVFGLRNEVVYHLFIFLFLFGLYIRLD
jgi:hypothetical protein